MSKHCKRVQIHVFMIDTNPAFERTIIKQGRKIPQVGVQKGGASGAIQCSGAPTGGSLGASPLKLGALKAGFIVHARVDKVLAAAEKKGKLDNPNFGYKNLPRRSCEGI